MKEQKAIIVRDNVIGTESLDIYLKAGWRVVNTCAMPSSYGTGQYGACVLTHGTCLVIIELDKPS